MKDRAPMSSDSESQGVRENDILRDGSSRNAIRLTAVRSCVMALLLFITPIGGSLFTKPPQSVTAEPSPEVICRGGAGVDCCSTIADCFYVSPDGNDGNDATSEARAVATLSGVHKLINPQTMTRPIEVRIKQGTYYTNGTVEWRKYHPTYAISFMPSDYAYGAWGSFAGRPVFDGEGAAAHWFGFLQRDKPGEATNLRFYYLKVINYSNGIVLEGHPTNAARWNGFNKVYGIYFYRLGSKWSTEYEGRGGVFLVNSRNNNIRNNHFVELENVGGEQGGIHAVYIRA
jgi:hypothetical protein